MENEKEFRSDNTYGSIERRLRDDGFNVLHLHRDGRGDWGDDGGFIVAVCEKNEITYLHILQVNYNMDVSCQVLEQNDKRLNPETFDDIRDFIVCASVEDAQNKINKVIELLEIAVKLEDTDDDFYGLGELWEDWDEYPEYLNEFKDDKFYLKMLCNMYSSYSERYGDKEALLKLTQTPYVPDYRCCYAVQDEE